MWLFHPAAEAPALTQTLRPPPQDWQRSPQPLLVSDASLSLSKKSGLTGDIQAKIGQLLFQNRKETHASRKVNNNILKEYGCTNTRI